MINSKKIYRDLLGGVDCYSSAEIKQLGITQDKSLGKTKQKSPYEVINEKLVAMLKKGDLPWINQRTSAPYKGQDATFRNFITKRAYSGVNTLMLSAEVQDHHNCFFLTQSQVESKGKAIKRGAKPFVIFFTKKLSVTKETPATDTAPATSQEKKIWFLRQYVVYNVADTTIELKEKDQPKAKTLTQVIESCETIYPNMPKRPPLQHKGSGAFYQPASDFVNMPVQSTFTTLQGYYRTFFHELIHSTGHEKRLKRKFAMSKNSKDYAVEELIAEIGSSYICGYTGIFFANAEKHASYLNHYLKELHGSKLAQYKADLVLKAQEDKTYLLHAIGAAQKGANFILSKQLAKAKKDKELKKKSKTLAGTIIKTNIKLLKAAVKKHKSLGRTFKKARNFEPYTLTDHLAQYLLNRRVKTDSFRRYGDPRHLNGKSGNLYRLHWLGSKGNNKEQPMDQMASDFISEYPQFHSLDESQVIGEMAEIIINYPTGAGAYMDDRIMARQFEADRYNDQPIDYNFQDSDDDSFPEAPKAEKEIEMLQFEVLALKLKLLMKDKCTLNGK